MVARQDDDGTGEVTKLVYNFLSEFCANSVVVKSIAYQENGISRILFCGLDQGLDAGVIIICTLL
jgi:hypothetical protein